MRSDRKKTAFSETLDRPMRLRACDCPGCDRPGEYRAPKGRDQLHEYFWFCLEHVQEYNKKWDYLEGYTPEQIEEHIRASTMWERPTWPLGEWQKREKALRDQLSRDLGLGGRAEDAQGAETKAPSMESGEREALAVLDLTPPVDFAAIKAQYRLLVKKHHPDANAGSREAEEIFKNVNQAFTFLRKLYEPEDSIS